MTAERPITFAEHIQELRKRLMWSLLFVGLGAGIGYALHNTLLGILQQPLHEKLYYTTPTGALLSKSVRSLASSFRCRRCCTTALLSFSR